MKWLRKLFGKKKCPYCVKGQTSMGTCSMCGGTGQISSLDL